MIEQAYDDRDGFIWYDGQLVPWRDARLHILSHGLHYAGAAFEGQRAYDGNIFKLTDKKPERSYTLDEIKNELPSAVATIQFREKYDAWVKGLRAKAHIEYRSS